MTMWENQVEKEHHRKPVPEGFISGEGTLSEAPLTPPSIFPDIPSDLSAAGHGEFLRKRRMLAKVLQQLQASGLPGQEQAQTFMLDLYCRNCRPNTLRAYSGAIQLFLTFLRHTVYSAQTGHPIRTKAATCPRAKRPIVLGVWYAKIS